MYRAVRMRQPEGALMAQRTVIQLVDDLDGTEIVDGAGETVTFALDGGQYEIDLTNDHADEMRAALDHYVQSARKVGGRHRRARARPPSRRRPLRSTTAPRLCACGPGRTRSMSPRAAASHRVSWTGSAPPATDTQDGREGRAEWLGPPAAPSTAPATDPPWAWPERA